MPTVEQLNRLHQVGTVFEGKADKMPVIKARPEAKTGFEKKFVISRNKVGQRGTVVINCSDSAEAKQRYAAARGIDVNENHLFCFVYNGEVSADQIKQAEEGEAKVVNFVMTSSVDELDVGDQLKGLFEEAGLNTIGDVYQYDVKHLDDGGITVIDGIGEARRAEFYEAIGMEAPDPYAGLEDPE